MTEPPTPPGSLPNHNPPDRPPNHMLPESIRSTQWEIQHQKQHVKQHVKHWFFAAIVAGAGKGNFQKILSQKGKETFYYFRPFKKEVKTSVILVMYIVLSYFGLCVATPSCKGPFIAMRCVADILVTLRFLCLNERNISLIAICAVI